MGYFDRRAELRGKAQAHTKKMEEKFEREIAAAIANTKIVEDGERLILSRPFVGTQIEVVDKDTVSAIFESTDTNDSVAILNFASFKNPGGMFFEGSSAQEESLCHESFLYNVLREFQETYYVPNRKLLNKSLYCNRALVSDKIIFERNGCQRRSSVITCAAPNKAAAQKYCNVPDSVVDAAMESRIQFIFKIAASRKYNTLILGAYGCGVFGNSAYTVAGIFAKYARLYQGVFKKIIFAVPNKDGLHFKAFAKVFEAV